MSGIVNRQKGTREPRPLHFRHPQNAGSDQHIIPIGTTVHLDGTHSYDPDGDAMTYAWTFVSIPAGSKARLTGPTTATPTFVADVDGTYVIRLIVTDSWNAASQPATVTVGFTNVTPVANAGISQAGVVGDLVTLDGSGSHDANLLPLTYQWSFASRPTGSLAVVANAISVQASFVPDQPGTYVVQLVVKDAFLTGTPSTVQEKVVTVLDNALSLVQNVITTVGSLRTRVFVNPTMKNTLIGMLQNAMTDLEQGSNGGALQDLQDDVMVRVNGCAEGGKPDKDDWIISCPSQTAVYQKLLSAIEEVNDLLGK